MSLVKYKKKRELEKSHEPAAQKGASGEKSAKSALRFVVQEHHARRLHYDFRLEYKGALLSWAIPKGPSMNPQDKRLAIHVEDHPLDYQYFEGTIPKGNYGAGEVEIWDKGTYTVQGASTRSEVEKKIQKGLEKGHLEFILHGEELSGAFDLVKLHNNEAKDQWLLIKKRVDNAVSETPLPNNKNDPFPKKIVPMLSTLVSKPFENEEWLFEVKWDGYRALAYIKEKDIELLSRNNIKFNTRFSSVVEDLKHIQADCILDGEVVVLDKEGKSKFQLMQNYQKTGKGDIVYYVFDILYKDGVDLREMPLEKRKKILKALINSSKLTLVRYSDHILAKGTAFFNAALKNDLEGIMAKRLQSAYQSRRSKDWLKIKTSHRQEVVIGGFTEPRGSRRFFGALLVGVYKDGKLHYAGHVGGGFDTSLLKSIFEELKPLEQKECPFVDQPKANAPVTWVSPKLICEVSFAEWTEDNIMRQPIFHGLRKDKAPKKVEKEMPIVPPKAEKELSFTHLDKVYWPDEHYTKGDLIKYYQEVAPYILPYLKDRPIVLHRFPEGIKGESFYQKDLVSALPKGIHTTEVAHEGKKIHYLLIDNLESLLYAVNLGSIDIHPFLARVGHLTTPDFCVLDLDPQGVEWKVLIEIALATHELLDDLKVKHFCKTSGGRGLHIYIPLHAKYTFEQSKQFAQIIVTTINEQLPKTTSLERNPQKRLKQVYLDYLQNRQGQTLVAPYAVRPRPGALVSTPLEWDEVNEHLDPKEFNIKTMNKRLKKAGDPFKAVLSGSVDIQAVLKRLHKSFLRDKMD